MNSKAIRFLEDHLSETTSSFEKEARWRLENEPWLSRSRGVALSIISYMQEQGLSRADLAKLLNVSPQYMSRIISGKENFSLKTIAKIETGLGIKCLK